MKTIQKVYQIFSEGRHVQIDSRKVQHGDIFIALKGENHNGNTFAMKALEQGASLAVVDEAEYAVNERCILVPDTLLFLQQLAHHHRRQLNIPILGITGTNGKTTTKELCHAVLSKKFRTVATQGNYNNHIGVPLTLLSMDKNTEIGIVEMGANHPGEIQTLCDIAEPNYGIITNIGYAHLEGFESFENIVKTKTALYAAVQTKGGKIFVNASDELLMQHANEHAKITYGPNVCNTNGEIQQSIPYLVYRLKTLKGDLYIKTKLIGGYNMDNALAASAVGQYFEIDPLQIKEAIENYTPSNLRSQLLKTEQNTIVLDAYNANLSSMKVALLNFAEIQHHQKLIIIGEMRELGSFSKEAHTQILDIIAEKHLFNAILVGKNFEELVNKYTFTTYFENTDLLIEYIKNKGIRDCFILIKGSRGNQLERIVEYL